MVIRDRRANGHFAPIESEAITQDAVVVRFQNGPVDRRAGQHFQMPGDCAHIRVRHLLVIQVAPVSTKSVIMFTPFLCIAADVSSWYFTKLYSGFAWVVLISGGLMGLVPTHVSGRYENL